MNHRLLSISIIGTEGAEKNLQVAHSQTRENTYPTMPPRRSVASCSKFKPAKKQRLTTKGKQRAMRLHDSEAEESDEDAEADASEHGNDMSNINTVASLTKGQRNYRIRIAIKYTDFRPIHFSTCCL